MVIFNHKYTCVGILHFKNQNIILALFYLKKITKKSTHIMNEKTFNLAKITAALDNYLERRRPPENIRDQLDIAFKIEGQSVYILEVRPYYDLSLPEPCIDVSRGKMEIPVAKTTFVKVQNHWKIFWLRSDNKWYSYDPKPIVKSIDEFLKVVEKDEFHCFWG
jgi:hypothetical protein